MAKGGQIEQAKAGPRGRPRSFDTESVLTGALELFWKQGYRATTLRHLEARLGVSQSSLYNTFGSKEALLIAALERYEKAIDERVMKPLVDSGGGLDAIDRFLLALGAWVTQDGRRGCMVTNLMVEDGGESDRITSITSAHRAQVRTALRDALGRSAELGEIEAEGLDGRADLLMALILGINVTARGGAQQTEVSRLLESARAEVAGWRVA